MNAVTIKFSQEEEISGPQNIKHVRTYRALFEGDKITRIHEHILETAISGPVHYEGTISETIYLIQPEVITVLCKPTEGAMVTKKDYNLDEISRTPPDSEGRKLLEKIAELTKNAKRELVQSINEIAPALEHGHGTFTEKHRIKPDDLSRMK